MGVAEINHRVHQGTQHGGGFKGDSVLIHSQLGQKQEREKRKSEDEQSQKNKTERKYLCLCLWAKVELEELMNELKLPLEEGN